MKLRVPAILLATLLASSAARAQGPAANQGDLQRAIEFAKSRVYPALVNISVVMQRYQGGRPVRISGSGSGVVVSPAGHILTNFHVAGGAVRLLCTLPTNETIEADVIVDDPLTDLSVLQLRLKERRHPEEPLLFASLGDSDALRIGDYVLAMGNPQGLSSSMTLGIVSNPRRVFTGFAGEGIQEMRLDEGEATGLLTRWIQHDALIVGGNSGGPLVNLAGEVVGINELGGTGIGFAIPSNLAARVMQQALALGAVRRGWLGLGLYPVEKMGRDTGALVASILEGSPAEKVGIVPGDVLLAVDGEPVRALFFEEIPLLYQRIAQLAPGQRVRLGVLRGGETSTVEAEVALMEDSLGREVVVPKWGITVREITGPMALARRWASTDGVLVTGVRAGFPAADAKPPLPGGAVVVEVAGKPVKDVDGLLKVVEETAGKKDLLVRYRDDYEDLLTALDTSDKPEPKRGRELPKAWIGVRTQVLTTDVARALGMEDVRGFRITEVFPGTEAERAGIRAGDIVTEIDGDKLKASQLQDAQMWRRKVETLVIDTQAELTLLRSGEKIAVSVLLQETPSSAVQAKTHEDGDLEFTVREITLADRLGRQWDPAVQGVVVTSVTPGGWASLAGLQGGDLVEKVQDRAVPDLETFQKVLEEVKGTRPATITVFVRRGFRTAFVFIEPDWGRTK